MHRHRQDVLELVNLQQRGSNGDLGRDVERYAENIGQHAVERILLHRDNVENVESTRFLDDLLVTRSVVLRVHGSQDLVASDHVGDAGAQRLDIQWTCESQNHRDVVCRRIGIEAIEEPHTSLRSGERNPRRPRLRTQRGPPRTLGSFHHCSQLCDSGRLEDHTHGQVRSRRGVDPPEHPSCTERIAAAFEEVVVDAHLPRASAAENLGKSGRHRQFGRCRRCTETTCLEDWLR